MRPSQYQATPSHSQDAYAHLITLDQTQQVFAEHLGDHADMITVGTTMAEVVEEANDVAATCMEATGV